MLLHGVNKIDGREVKLCMIACNLQVEVIIIEGSPAGLIFHYATKVILSPDYLKYQDRIQTDLFFRTKKLYPIFEMTSGQHQSLSLRWGWCMQNMGSQMSIVLGVAEDDDFATEFSMKGGTINSITTSQLCPVIIRDYDYVEEMGEDYCRDDDRYVKRDDDAPYLKRRF